jgi:hypothetical protein
MFPVNLLQCRFPRVFRSGRRSDWIVGGIGQGGCFCASESEKMPFFRGLLVQSLGVQILCASRVVAASSLVYRHRAGQRVFAGTSSGLR